MTTGRHLLIFIVRAFGLADYEHFASKFERLIRQHGNPRVLFDMTGFHGWEGGVLWEDIKFEIKRFADIERLAMVGEKKWQHGMAAFCKPFTTATIRYFDHTDADGAWTSLAEPAAQQTRRELP
jgi:hypothetical protein